MKKSFQLSIAMALTAATLVASENPQQKPAAQAAPASKESWTDMGKRYAAKGKEYMPTKENAVKYGIGALVTAGVGYGMYKAYNHVYTPETVQAVINAVDAYVTNPNDVNSEALTNALTKLGSSKNQIVSARMKLDRALTLKQDAKKAKEAFLAEVLEIRKNDSNYRTFVYRSAQGVKNFVANHPYITLAGVATVAGLGYGVHSYGYDKVAADFVSNKASEAFDATRNSSVAKYFGLDDVSRATKAVEISEAKLKAAQEAVNNNKDESKKEALNKAVTDAQAKVDAGKLAKINAEKVVADKKAAADKAAEEAKKAKEDAEKAKSEANKSAQK